MNTPRLPQTDSIQEMAQFWDAHDVTEFEGELEEVAEPVFERHADVTVRLATADAKRLREMARSRGIRETELISEWVHERIHAT